jgi:hypothetical protein
MALAALGVFTAVMRRRGYSGFGGNTIVRCRDGHLFTTIWVPGVSVKAVRLGLARIQRCPVGAHWSLVRPVKDSDLSQEEREFAAAHHDIRVP